MAQMVQSGECHQTVWGSDHRVVKIEWKLALNEDYGSSEANKMTVQTNQLLCMKKATSMKNIYP